MSDGKKGIMITGFTSAFGGEDVHDTGFLPYKSTQLDSENYFPTLNLGDNTQPQFTLNQPEFSSPLGLVNPYLLLDFFPLASDKEKVTNNNAVFQNVNLLNLQEDIRGLSIDCWFIKTIGKVLDSIFGSGIDYYNINIKYGSDPHPLNTIIGFAKIASAVLGSKGNGVKVLIPVDDEANRRLFGSNTDITRLYIQSGDEDNRRLFGSNQTDISRSFIPSGISARLTTPLGNTANLIITMHFGLPNF